MIYSTVEFTRAGRRMTAHLTDKGWTVPKLSWLGEALEMLSPTSEYGPADGDPVHRATWEAARLLDGRITFLRALDTVLAGFAS